MTNLQVEPKNSTNFFMSKAVTLFTCPQKYYWQYHRWVHPKGENHNFLIGRIAHKAAELFFLHDVTKAIEYINFSELGEEDKQLCLHMLAEFVETISTLQHEKKFEIVTVEKAVSLPLEGLSTFFTDWRVKADFIHHDTEGLWNADIKTTGTTGPKVAEYYHNSPQTLTYLFIMKKYFPGVNGTKIYVLTKKKVRCEVETILVNDSKLYQAERFIIETLKTADRVDEDIFTRGEAEKFMTSCDNLFQGACPYKPLCFNRNGKKQEEFLIQDWFELKDPDEHLELGKE